MSIEASTACCHKIYGWLVEKSIEKRHNEVRLSLKFYDCEFEIKARYIDQVLSKLESLKLEDFVEIVVDKDIVVDVVVISDNEVSFPFSPRKVFNIFEYKFADINRHLYLRSPGFRFILTARDILLSCVRKVLRRYNFLEVHPPIITQVPLYTDETLMPLKYFKWDAYLSQCVGFYLEALTFAFEKVYNISPSFRGEKSKGSKYLNEYWHLKGELAFFSRDELMSFINSFIREIVFEFYSELELVIEKVEEFKEFSRSILDIEGRRHKFETMDSFEVITYDDAIKILREEGFHLEWGNSIPEKGERILGEKIKKLYWIIDFPRKKEPFPYKIHPEDSRKTLTADLMSDEFGEICGVAEKITNINELIERMEEKGKKGDERYRFVVDLRKSGMVSHSGFGMGVERLLRLLLGLPHVKYAIPFPRLLRKPYP